MTCESEKAVNIMSLSFLEMANGDIGLFYLVRQTYTHMRMYLRRSADGGNTWSDRVLCMPEDGYYVVNNDRVRRFSFRQNPDSGGAPCRSRRLCRCPF